MRGRQDERSFEHGGFMNSKLKTLLGIILFAALLGGAYYAYQMLSAKNVPGKFGQNLEVPTQKPTPAGDEKAEVTPAAEQTPQAETDPAENNNADENPDAIDFTVYDAAGNEVKLSDFYGKPIIINFWTTWCPYCIEEMPYFEEAWKKYGEEINFLMVDCVDGDRETQEMGESYIEKNGFTFPVYYDTTEIAAYTYQIYSLPTSVFIDSEGKILVYYPGRLTAEMLQKGIDLILPAQ